MLSRLVSPDARELVLRDVSDLNPELVVWERERNLEALNRECGNLPRLLAGIGAWALAVLGAAGLVLAAWSGTPAVLRVLGLVAGVAVLGVACWLGLAVWRAGRAVVDAYAWWELLPTRLRDGLPPQLDRGPLANAVETRTFMLQGARMVRTGAAALAFLGPFLFLLFATEDSPRFDAFWPSDQGAALLVAVLGLIAVSWTAGVILFGGQWKANLAHSRRDPVQTWILGRTGKLFRGR
jgi:hypothetical protein